MSVLSWNCRGAAAPATVSEAQDLCRKIKPDILFLIETRAKECRIMKLKRKLRFEKHFCVEPRGLSGGLCLLWNKNLDVDVYAWSDNYIKAKIKDDNNYEWSCYFVYGNPKFQHRKAQWKELSTHNRPTNDPQIFIGDFNDILDQEEKVGLHPKPRSQIEEFRKFINYNGLMDLELKGGRFTWFSNPRNGFVTKERLDRALANWAWRMIYQNATLTALPAISSDYCLILLQLKPKGRSSKQFKYEAYWEDHEECKEIIKRGWNKNENQGGKWEHFSGKIRNCKIELSKWSKETFRRADREINRLKEELMQLQKRDLTEEVQQHIITLKKKIEALWRREEKY
ncbi:uncharacterized protein LOC130979601 [Arachis stenosperma]|uniref:uncharacterized protein LOC130979601 n=1 Tax=Arachis stenosperma TaxID=217475 RepID=UPI0025ACA3E8|nr:uncharacterized protein LOC130979601 [Arachis stenosperma]